MAPPQSGEATVKLKVTQVEALPPAKLLVTWESGKQSEVDIGEYLQAQGHERLRDPAFFATVQVEEWGHGVEWVAADIGIPAQALYRLSKEQSSDAFPTAEFNAWMERHSLSLAAAARALHLTRRTIIYYSTGAKPIPAYIGLACRGWEAIHRKRVA